MLEQLQKMKQNIASAEGRCESLGSLEGRLAREDGTDEQDDLSHRATQVSSQLEQTTRALERELTRCSENVSVWEAVETLKQDLQLALQKAQSQLKTLQDSPAKLHVDAAQTEVTNIQVRFQLATATVCILLTLTNIF